MLTRTNLRSAGYVLGTAFARSVVLAFAVAEATSAYHAHFVAEWTLLWMVPMVPLALLELPVVLALPWSEERATADTRAALAAAFLGIAWGLALPHVVPWAIGIGTAWSVFACAAGGLGGWVAAPDARLDWRGGAAGGVACVALAVGFVLADPLDTARLEEPADPAIGGAAGQGSGVARPPERTEAQSKALAERWMATHPPERLAWDWQTALLAEGLIADARRRQVFAGTDYARAWIDHAIEHALARPLDCDGVAPIIPLLALDGSGRGPDAELIERVTTWLASRAPRTSRGVPSHHGDKAMGLLPRKLSVVDLYGYGVALGRIAVFKRDSGLLDEARAVMSAGATALAEPVVALFRHAEYELGVRRARLPVEPCFWAMGNALALHAFVRHCENVRLFTGRHPAKERELVEALVRSLVKCQDPGGMWRADLEGLRDDAVNPPDTAATALIAATLLRGMASELIRPKEAPGADRAAMRAGLGLRSRVLWRPHPRVVGIAREAPPGFAPLYRLMPHDEDRPHGVGAVLLWLAHKR